MSQVTFQLSDGIKGNDESSPAKIWVKSMSFNNTIRNITTSNNKLKVFTSWAESGIVKSRVIHVTVPPNHYDLNSLLAFLNKQGTCNGNENPPGGVGTLPNFSPAVGNRNAYKGLGVWGDLSSANTTPGTNTGFPPFIVDPNDPSKLLFQGPTAGKGVLGTYTHDYEYRSVGLIYDNDTKGLMIMLGVVANSSSGGDPSNITTFIDDGTSRGIELRVHHNDGAYSYINPCPFTVASPPTTFEQGLTPPQSVLNLAGPQRMSIELSGLSSHVRESYRGNSKGNTICIVPLAAYAYGQSAHYEPPNPITIVAEKGYSISEIILSIKDSSTGYFVDFQGSDWTIDINIEYVDKTPPVHVSNYNTQDGGTRQLMYAQADQQQMYSGYGYNGANPPPQQQNVGHFTVDQLKHQSYDMWNPNMVSGHANIKHVKRNHAKVDS